MSYEFNIGDKVEWDWANGTGSGKITKRYTQKITKTIKGSEITRNADDDEPAYLIEQDDGDEVLKSTTEIRSS